MTKNSVMTNDNVRAVNVLHFDWPKLAEGLLTSAGGAGAVYLFGRRAQAFREKMDTRTQDQKNIDQLLGRVDALEKKMVEAGEKIEALRSEKVELQVQIVSLREQIAVLEVRKVQLESREVMYAAQLAALQQLLDAKTEQLLCMEEKLKQMETKGENPR